MTNVIMLTGKAGCGKDTFYNIADNYIYDATMGTVDVFNRAFADKIKESLYDLGWDGKKDDKGRRLLQHFGQTMREYDKDIWAKFAYKCIYDTEFSGVESVHIITDLRFPNEYTYVRDNLQEDFPNSKLTVIKIVDRQSDLGANANDISEAGITEDILGKPFDYVLHNDGTLAEYKLQIKHVLEDLELL